MPIVWKTSFEEPLNKLMLSGTVGNSKQLVNAIALLYDTSIKQGLPIAPGTPAGPLVGGNIIVFKKMLDLYFKLNASKNQIGIVKTYASLIKSVLLTIKTINSQIKTKTTELKATAKDITTTRKDILKTTAEIAKLSSQLSKPTDVNLASNRNKLDKYKELRKKLIDLNLKLSKYKVIEIEIKAFIEKYKQKIITFVRPKIQLIKDQLKKLIKKLLFPQLQENKLTLFRKLPVYIKRALDEYRENKRLITDVIVKSVGLIKTGYNDIQVVRSALNKQDKKQFSILAKQMIKGGNIGTITAAAAKIVSMIEKYPDKVISADQKNVVRQRSAKIVELQNKIEIKKEELKKKIKAKLKKKKDEIIKSIKLRKGKKTPKEKIEEINAKRKEFQDIVKEIQRIVKRIKELITLAKLLKAEITTINKLLIKFNTIRESIITANKKAQTFNARKAGKSVNLNTINSLRTASISSDSINQQIINATKNLRYIPNPSLIAALEKERPGLGEKYKALGTPETPGVPDKNLDIPTQINRLKTFIVTQLKESVEKQDLTKKTQKRVKNKLKQIKDKIIRGRGIIQTALFNKFLKLAVAGYWTGGVLPLGFITSPGIVPYRVPMAMNSDSSIFVKNLTRALALHTKTVSGIYLQPSPTGPIPIPWIGYF